MAFCQFMRRVPPKFVISPKDFTKSSITDNCHPPGSANHHPPPQNAIKIQAYRNPVNNTLLCFLTLMLLVDYCTTTTINISSPRLLKERSTSTLQYYNIIQHYNSSIITPKLTLDLPSYFQKFCFHNQH